MGLATSTTAGAARTPSTGRALIGPVACGCALAIGAAFVAAADVGGSATHLPACPFHELTGLWCPGCGLTRATHALFRGHVAAAFGFNLFFPLFLGAIVIGWGAWLRRAIGAAPVIAFARMPTIVPVVLAGMLIVFGVARNLPGFEALRP